MFGRLKASLVPVDTPALVKGLAIVLVVVVHVRIYHGVGIGLAGGLNALLLVSGIMMARFAFHDSTAHTLKAFWGFSRRIAVPSLVLTIACSISSQKFSWQELAFISNWTSIFIPNFPLWYVEIIVQLMVVFSLLFWSFDLTPRFLKAPVKYTALAYAGSLGIFLFSRAFWGTNYQLLPHLFAWNFILGWFFWAMLLNDRSLRNCLILTLTLLLSALLIRIAGGGQQRLVSLCFFGLLLIWTESIPLPRPLAHIILLISQATFYIFLTHLFVFSAARKLGHRFDVLPIIANPLLMIFFGILIPTLLWALVTATLRTYRKIKYDGEYVSFLTQSSMKR